MSSLRCEPISSSAASRSDVGLFVLFAEGVAALEGDAPFGLAEQGEELRRKLVEALQDAVQLRRAELLHAADGRDVAAQLLEAVVADRDAEVLAGDVLDLVRFVEHHGVIFGQDAALVLLVAQREVGEEQVVIDDDDVAFERALVHQGDEAALELRALLAGAELACGRPPWPRRCCLRAAS